MRRDLPIRRYFFGLDLAGLRIISEKIMKVAIIGAGRNKNGIGPFTAKYFHNNDCQVVAAVGTTEATAATAVHNLEAFGISARGYTNAEQMLEETAPDAVVIASPTHTHENYIQLGLDAGCHIFCEKPFIWKDADRLEPAMQQIFNLAADKELTLAMNSQWPFSLPTYEDLCGSLTPDRLQNFIIRLSPVCGGREMLTDSLPHALSLLYAVFGDGDLADIRVRGSRDDLSIRFCYDWQQGSCHSLVKLIRQKVQPRTFAYGFNGRIIKRMLDLEDYSISFSYRDRRLTLKDPLELSVLDFIKAVNDRRAPLIGKNHILKTTSMLKAVYDSYQKEG